MSRPSKGRPGCFEGNPQRARMTDIGVMHVLELASLGYSLSEIARYLRVDMKLLKHRIDPEHDLHDERVSTAWDDGQHEFTGRLRKAQLNLSEVNATMAIHMGKQYLGQTDKREVEVTQTIHLVGTMPDYGQSPEDWQRKFAPSGIQNLIGRQQVINAVVAPAEEAETISFRDPGVGNDETE